MVNGGLRKWMTVGAAMALSVTVAGLANATAFTFDTSGGANTTATSKVYTSNTVGGTNIKVNVTAWHWNDPGDQKIVSAALGLWSPGLGVLASGESFSGNQHQIDNISGVDFIMLQFDHAVSLTGIGRAVFDLGFNPDDSDAAYWADTGGLVGTAATWQSNVNLANYSFAPSLWTPIPGDGISGTTSVTGTPTASVWLIGADPGSSDRDDGFKLSLLNVNANVAAVPEPATWAMMVGGFGLIGGTMRRRRSVANTVASFA